MPLNNDTISYEYIFLEKEKVRLAYKKIGKGNKIMLLFHGYGQDCHCWGVIEENLKEEYTFFCFDLPFHGETMIGNPTKNSLEISLKEFLKQNNITDFSVLGFSLGARLALFCAEISPQNIQHIFLLAPDGIKNNFWFNLATRFWFSNALFSAFLAHQKLFMKFGKILTTIGLLDNAVLNFVQNQTNSQEKLKKIHQTWLFFAKIPSISTKEILKNIANKKSSNKKYLSIFLAQNDIFITQEDTEEKLQNIDFDIFTLDCNHFKLPLLLKDILTKSYKLDVSNML